MRYTGDLALCTNKKLAKQHKKSSSQLIIKQYQNAQRIHNRILCSVLISPGYDIGVAFAKQNWFSRQLILYLLKGSFVGNHKTKLEEKSEETIQRCSSTSCTLEFFREYSGSLSGYNDYDEFLLHSNPTETGKYAQIASLIINSRDDPICTCESLDEWKWLFTKKEPCPNAILCETKYGSHSSFLNIFGGFWLDSIILDYVKTVFEISRDRQNRNRNNRLRLNRVRN